MSEYTVRLQSNQNNRTTLLGSVAPRKFGQLIDVNMIGVANGDLVSYDAATQTYVPTSGIPNYSLSSGVSTSVIGGIGSISQLYVSGISTLGTVRISSGIITATSGVITYYGDGSKLSGINVSSSISISTNTTNSNQYIPYATSFGSTTGLGATDNFVCNPSTGNVGIGTTNPTSKLTIIGDVNVSGVITATTFFGNATTSTYASTAGIATYATSSGIATYADTAGIATYASTAGIATYATSSGIATYADTAGIATYASTAGIATYATSSGIATSVIGGIGSVSQFRVTGISTFTNGPVLIGSVFSTGTSFQTLQVTGGSYISGNLGIGNTNPTSKLSVDGDVNVSGVITSTTFIGNLIGTATTASSVSLNSVGLGTHTYGDYVQSITGTSNQITVTGGTGEGSSPVISIPTNPVLPGNVTISNDLQVNHNLNVTGNITIGGTSAYIISNDFRVKDADIVTGFTTDSNGNDVSNDTTANHGGIAVASTEGSPLVQLYNVSIGETNPATYKKIMWFKSGSFAGLNTDAWLINYAVGIGSTQFPSGTRLAAGSVQFTENDLAVVRNINASGIVTASNFSGNASSATYASIAGIATVAQGLTGTPNINVGIVTATEYYGTFKGTLDANVVANTSNYASTAGIATYADTAGIATVSQGLTGTPNISVTHINASGISTLGTIQISSGIVTATSGVVTYYGDGSKLTGVNSFNVVAQSTSNNPVYPTFAENIGVSSVGISTQQFVFMPINGNVGIGTTSPTSKLHVVGDVNITGVITATSFVGDGSGLTNVSGSSGVNSFILSYMF